MIICDDCLAEKFTNKAPLSGKCFARCACCKLSRDCTNIHDKSMMPVPPKKRPTKPLTVAQRFNIYCYKKTG